MLVPLNMTPINCGTVASGDYRRCHKFADGVSGTLDGWTSPLRHHRIGRVLRYLGSLHSRSTAVDHSLEQESPTAFRARDTTPWRPGYGYRRSSSACQSLPTHSMSAGNVGTHQWPARLRQRLPYIRRIMQRDRYHDTLLHNHQHTSLLSSANHSCTGSTSHFCGAHL